MEKDDFECDYEAEHYSCCILLLVNYQLLSVAESMSKANSSSFDAFSKVDQLVSKPVYGSETIASWQSFRKDHGPKHPSSAPKAPLKKADKLSTGFNTWEEERAHEGEIRREAGHAATNSGYQLFNDEHKKKAEEAAERKRKARIEARIRPDDKEYLIPSKTFEGWKFDYVFTTKNGTTGYYWDGMDSIKKENGELAVAEKMEPSQAPSTSEAKDSEKPTEAVPSAAATGLGAKATPPKSAPGCVPPADDLAAKLAKRRNWEAGSGEGVSREQQAIEAAEREQKEREERVRKQADAKASADAEYKRKIAEAEAKRRAQAAAEQAEQAAHEAEAERAREDAVQQAAAEKLAKERDPPQQPQVTQQRVPPQEEGGVPQNQSASAAAGLRKTGLLDANPLASGAAADSSPVEKAKAALAQSRQGKEVGANKKKIDVASLFEDKDADDAVSLFKNNSKSETPKGGRLFGGNDGGDQGAGRKAKSKAAALFGDGGGGDEDGGEVLGMDELKALEEEQKRAVEESKRLVAQEQESKAKAAMLKQRAQNSMFDDDDDEWGDTGGCGCFYLLTWLITTRGCNCRH